MTISYIGPGQDAANAALLECANQTVTTAHHIAVIVKEFVLVTPKPSPQARPVCEGQP